MSAPEPAGRLSIVFVSGLSGGGKSSVLHAFEDLGYEAVDNPPLQMIEDIVRRSEGRLAVGVDARTRGFDAELMVDAIKRLRADDRFRPALVYVAADEATLLRRYSETRRRHPLVPQGRVQDGIAREQVLTEPLREAADLVLDTSGLPLAAMRLLIERHFGASDGAERGAEAPRMVVSLVSFAYSHGLPRDADLVFDARFLRNPHYDPILRSKTGLDQEVGPYVEADPDFAGFFARITALLDLVLPRFVQEGKKYATIAVGCTGGRHRSVHIVEKLAGFLALRSASGVAGTGWRLLVAHRELAREGNAAAYLADRSEQRRSGTSVLWTGEGARPSPQAQEA